MIGEKRTEGHGPTVRAMTANRREESLTEAFERIFDRKAEHEMAQIALCEAATLFADVLDDAVQDIDRGESHTARERLLRLRDSARQLGADSRAGA
jgi:hypothetical protein